MKVSLPTLLVILFVVLKLTGVIAWSWAWVFSPWWITLVLLTLLAIFITFVDTMEDSRYQR